MVPQRNISGLSLIALNNLLLVYQDYQSLRLTPTKVKQNWIPMYQWKHQIKLLQKNTESSPKKGFISIMNHTLKKKSTPQKYKCKICGEVLDSVHELTTHHQTNHHILYCSTCRKAFNNPLSLSRHEYEHKNKGHKCPKCDHTFTFESQVKAHMFSHRSKPSFFCVHPGCDRVFFNESNLTRHSK